MKHLSEIAFNLTINKPIHLPKTIKQNDVVCFDILNS